MAIIDNSAPTGSSGREVESFDCGLKIDTAINVGTMAMRLARNAEPHQYGPNWKMPKSIPVSRPPTTSGPSAPPAPAKPAHTAIALLRSCGGKMAVMIDNVAGMMNAAPAPITTRATITPTAMSTSEPSIEPSSEGDETHLQHGLATEAVADRAGAQQQTGEDDRVRVDDPGEVGRRCVHVVLHLGNRHVEAGDGHHDHDETETHDAEKEPSAFVDAGIVVQLAYGRRGGADSLRSRYSFEGRPTGGLGRSLLSKRSRIAAKRKRSICDIRPFGHSQPETQHAGDATHGAGVTGRAVGAWLRQAA